MKLQPIYSLIDRFYKKPYYYLYSMSIYHIIIILFTFYGITIYRNQVFFSLDFNFAEQFNSAINIYSIKNILFSLIILIVDLIFFFILAYEFKQLKLTMAKITVLETIIFVLCIYFPYVRVSMLFLSLNSIQIFIPYMIMKTVGITKYIFLTGSYLNIIYCLIYPIIHYSFLLMSVKPWLNSKIQYDKY
jgi:hypothetical protein